MATRKSSRRGGGQFKQILITGVTLLVLAGGLLGWWRSMGFTGVGDVLDWARQKSASTGECIDGQVDGTADGTLNALDCYTPDLGDGSSGAPGATTPPGETATPNPGETTAPTLSSSEQEAAVLAALNTVAIGEPQDVAYSRSEWKHWSDLDGNGCDAREDTLIAYGTDVVADPKSCKILSGSWEDLYGGGDTITDPGAIDIDHLIALSYAAQHGGQAWSAEQKQAFANDTVDNLFPSLAKENRSKGDKGPSEYMPPNPEFKCEYSSRFITVANKYNLTITEADKEALATTVEIYC